MSDLNSTTSPPSVPVELPQPIKKKIVLRRSAAKEVFPPTPKYKVEQQQQQEQSILSSESLKPSCRHGSITRFRYLTEKNENESSSSSSSSLLDIKRIIEIEFQFDKEDENTFKPGDYLSIFAPNPFNVVESIANRLNLNLNDRLDIEMIVVQEGKVVNLPDNLKRANARTIGYLLSHELDICGIPSKRLLRLLGENASDQEEKKKLVHLSSIEGKEDYNQMIGNRITLLDLLISYPSISNIPLHYLVDFISPLVPRDYSISSSPLSSQPRHATVVFSVVDMNINQKEIKGLCTSWLEDKCNESILNNIQQLNIDNNNNNNNNNNTTTTIINNIPYEIKPTNHFTLPKDTLKTPMIMIGPGTGVAPFIGFLSHLEKTKQPDLKLAETWLFFGCRSESYDFIYRDEIESFVKNGTLSHLVTAFSRESKDQSSQPLGYVQSKLLNHSSQLFNLITNNNATIYICGDAKGMAVGVKSAFIEIVKKELKMMMTNKQMKLFLNGLQIKDIY
ncbi:hypothetical protein DFA_03353 [Cavenderia fasciculata]|uniref:FAD-binding FR-type domain-containing protein n=1 Tax=Cavenderia fasciculata TaxID=261658 RepID=F4PHC3_CACFS|nr:uncharacterized protein DFA_03353 [Cavenderia fasciculata]EGG25107.1 hypothetical protein DFA_03353 [Cavenderia fasciculata]|eukprot:XP_004362958.1 hypothetical protein DFA_03353 [Cavenderia fasciculata]